MRARSLCLGFLYLIFCVPSAHAADLTKIERTIAKEPKYQGEPEYCLLVFGPEAGFRVWLVADGDVLYVDRNGNGDLTEPGECARAKIVKKGGRRGTYLDFGAGRIVGPGGMTEFDLNSVRYEKQGTWEIYISGGGRYDYAGLDGPGPLRFASRPEDAPTIHSMGPITLRRFDPSFCSLHPVKPGPLVRGQPNELAFSVGTPGLGAGTFLRHSEEVRNGMTASVQIRFPGGATTAASLTPDL